MEGARVDPVDAERLETPPQLTGGSVGERNGEDLRCVERTAPDLARDAVRDRRRLPRPRSGKDGDRATECESGLSLGIVQSCEDALEVGHDADPNTVSSGDRRDVLVQSEQVLRVEPTLQLREAFELPVAVCGADARIALVAEEVDVDASGREGSERRGKPPVRRLVQL